MAHQDMTESQLRRAFAREGYILRKSRNTGSGFEHGPFYVLKPETNFMVSHTHHPNGMQFEEAADFLAWVMSKG